MRRRIARALALAFTAATAAGLTLIPAASAGAINWPQWGQNPQHQGFVDVVGQNLAGQFADITFDPFVRQEQGETDGDLLAHYQAPLVHQEDVFMEFKTGRYVSCAPPGSGKPPAGEAACGLDSWNTQIWNQRRLHWEGGQLVEKWNYQSGWKPEPADLTGGWEPVYHAVLANGFVYDPEFGGGIVKLNMGDGSVATRINPFGDVPDPNTFVASPLSADDFGNVYYNVLKLNLDLTAANSWLVKVGSDDSIAKVSYPDLLALANPPTDTCVGQFGVGSLPWPGPTVNSKPSKGACGPQRPGINVVPAIAPDGTIYTVSRADLNSRYSYVVAVNADLTLKWAASMRDRLDDGCGVLVPIAPTDAPTANSCRFGATPGVDPQTNQAPAGRVIDQSSSSPTVAPNGDVLYGAYSRYNAARGHLFQFDSLGTFKAAYDFGWDTTPATLAHDGTYSVVLKDNHYDVGLYCNPTPPNVPPNPVRDAVCVVLPAGPYFITQLSADLTPDWKFQNTETQSCSRNPDGSLSCTPNTHPNGFEWCINAPAIDKNGVVFANSEDGNLYAIKQGGVLKDRLFLNIAIGAAYTPLSIGPSGLIYTENDGRLFAVGTGGRGIGQGGGHAGTTRNGDRHTNLEPTD